MHRAAYGSPYLSLFLSLFLSQDNELHSKGAPPPPFPPSILPTFLRLYPSPPRLPSRRFCCSCCGQHVDEKTIFDLPCSRGPIVGPGSVGTVIHKSRTCILVHADQRDKQNRHELRGSASSRRNNSDDDDDDTGDSARSKINSKQR